MVRGTRPLRGSVKKRAAAAWRSSSVAVLRDRAQVRIEQLRSGVLAGLDIASHQLELRVRREQRRHAIRLAQFVPVDKTVVARGAFQIDSQKHLRSVLRRLHIRCLAGVDVAAPVHADQKAIRVVFPLRVDQRGDHLVVGQVALERGHQPFRNGFALALIIAAHIVAQQIVPPAHPILRVDSGVAQQRIDQPRAFVRAGILHEGIQLLRGRRQPPQVVIDAPGE